jgi:hypothetical protein
MTSCAPVMSVHMRPQSSPRRAPVVAASTHRACSRSSSRRCARRWPRRHRRRRPGGANEPLGSAFKRSQKARSPRRAANAGDGRARRRISAGMSALEDRWSPRAGKTAGDQRVLCTGPQRALCEVRHFMIRRSDLPRYRARCSSAFGSGAGLDEVRHEVRHRSRGAARPRRLASAVLSCEVRQRCGVCRASGGEVRQDR